MQIGYYRYDNKIQGTAIRWEYEQNSSDKECMQNFCEKTSWILAWTFPQPVTSERKTCEGFNVKCLSFYFEFV